MPGLTIAWRELSVAARRPRTPLIRAGAAAAASAALLILLAAGIRAPAGPAPGLFQILAIGACGVALVSGAVFSADAISSERREGTLGLLFLADLGGLDVALGKLTAAGVNAASAIAAAFPVFIVSWVVGGVTWGEVWRTAIAVGNALFLALALGIWVSSRRNAQRGSHIETFAWVALVTVGAGLGHRLLAPRPTSGDLRWWLGVSPWVALRAARDTAFRVDPQRFWSALELTHGAAWLAVFAAAWHARRYRIPAVKTRPLPPVELEISQDRRRVSVIRTGVRLDRERLEANPVFALLTGRSGASVAAWIAALVGIAANWCQAAARLANPHLQASAGRLMAGAASPPELIWLGLRGVEAAASIAIAALVALLVCDFVADGRRQGAIELLLTTSLPDTEVFTGLWTSVRHSAGRPMATWIAAALAGPLSATVQWILSPAGAPNHLASWWWEWATLAIALPLRVWAAAAFGVWRSLGPGAPAAAARDTLLWGVLAPILGNAVSPWLGPGLALGYSQIRLDRPLRELLTRTDD